MATPTPHSAACLLPAPRWKWPREAEIFQLNFRVTITFKKLPDKFLKILPGSFFLLWLPVWTWRSWLWLAMLSQGSCSPEAVSELFPGEGISQDISKGCLSLVPSSLEAWHTPRLPQRWWASRKSLLHASSGNLPLMWSLSLCKDTSLIALPR